MNPAPTAPYDLTIDRITPTQRCTGSPAGFQSWRSLLFMHWPVPVDILRRLVPAPLELDLYDGCAYVGLVPFVMRAIRPWWCPKALGFNFLETNVRTYVVHRGRPGVYFFSLEANSRIAVQTARSIWGLPYHYARMTMHHTDVETRYASSRIRGGDSFSVRCHLGPSLPPSTLGSLEFFFLERYLLFVERHGAIFSGQVFHTPYPVQTAMVDEVDDQLVAAAGLPKVDGMPAFVHYSAGVDVEVFPLQRIANAGE